MSARHVLFTCEIVWATEKAVLVSHADREIWLPKDAVRLQGELGWNDYDPGDEIEFSITENLAAEKEMHN